MGLLKSKNVFPAACGKTEPLKFPRSVEVDTEESKRQKQVNTVHADSGWLNSAMSEETSGLPSTG